MEKDKSNQTVISPAVEKYLNWVIERNPGINWQLNPMGKVEIIVKHKGFFDRVLQKLCHKPQTTTVSLDEVGSYLWQLFDGKQTLRELGKQHQEKFGSQVDPLYPRMIQFVANLHKAGFVRRVGLQCNK